MLDVDYWDLIYVQASLMMLIRILSTSKHKSQVRLLYAWDRNSRCRFLVDSGAEVSVLPASNSDKLRKPPSNNLAAAGNRSAIATYGQGNKP